MEKLFLSRMKSKGIGYRERGYKYKERSFKTWFDNALNRFPITLDNADTFAVIQDQNQNNNKDLSDDKYIIFENNTNVGVGSIVLWRDKTWLIFTDETKTIPTHQQFKMKESNDIIKWMVSKNVISGGGSGHHAFIQNQTLYTLGVSTSGTHSWIVNAKMMVYMQDNAETRGIKIGQRIYMGGAVYKVMFKDYISRQGLINFLFEEDFVNEEFDNVELQIANYYNFDDKEEETVVSSDYEIVIKGADKLKIGASLNVYEAKKIFPNDVTENVEIVEWTVVDADSVATIQEQSVNHISVNIVNNFTKVGSTITIVGRTSDNITCSKTVRIVSPY